MLDIPDNQVEMVWMDFPAKRDFLDCLACQERLVSLSPGHKDHLEPQGSLERMVCPAYPVSRATLVNQGILERQD